MTIQNTTLRKAGPSQGNGVTTVFPFTFKVFTATDILVTYLNALGVESVLVLSTNYTVALNVDQNASPGGSVTLLVAPATATYITLTSQLANTQTLALTNSGGFYPESINNALDRTVIEIQQLAEQTSRSITIPKSSTASPLLPVPTPLNVLAWNLDATAITNVSLESSSNLSSYKATGTGSVTRTVASKLNDVISVKDFGAVGDGVTDDGPALNLAFNYIRTYISVEGARATITLDLCGDTYLTNISLNATGLVAWGWAIKNGSILGKCTGKAVLDMIGSRGGYLEQITVEGDLTNMPSVGIQAARAESLHACDNMLFTAVNTLGYFSTAGVHFYGQETTTHEHCRYWNYNPNGYVAIHVGYSTIAMSSDYLAPITGAASFTNNSYINCDYRYLPTGNITNITGISKAASAVVTVSSHPFVNGDIVVIGFVSGMTEINNVKTTVASATPTSFVLTGVDSTAFSTYTSGGSAIKSQTKPSVLFSRGAQHHFDTCYIVNYGSDSLEVDFPDSTGTLMYSIWLDFLFEGIGSRSHLRFTSVTTTRDIRDFRFNTYNSFCRDCLISSDNATTNKVVIYNGDISWTNIACSNPTLLDDPNNFAFYAVDVFVPTTANFSYSGMTTYTGTYSSVQTGEYSLISPNVFGQMLIGTYTASGDNLLQVNSDALINGLTVGKGGGSGSVCTAFGANSLSSNTTGNQQVAIGTSSLSKNTTGNFNTACGSSTLALNTLGSGHTAFGINALLNSTTAVATLGAITGGSGYTNGSYVSVALTYVALSTATTYPTVNITVSGGIVTTCTLVTKGVGFKDITTVMTCASIGAGSGFAISPATLATAGTNTAVGFTSGQNVSTGSSNSFFGASAGVSVTTGSNNVIIGSYSGAAAPISATGSNYVVLSDGAGNIRTYYDASGNQVNYGLNATSAAAPTIASATTIAPTKAITFISGVTPIVTITVPSPISLGGGTITLIPTGIFTTTIAGNIALASTAIVSKALIMTYDVTTTKWYPSY